ncbi:MAG: 2-oxoacid:ferredoxin oxidoreductase subunit beta [Nitrospirae bacterium]|nr:2-oxoacid:ferredoxin oxidoreductase subunit beta [Nitrospirota bacterium]
MPLPDDYKGQTPAWCMGCGNFGILNAFRKAVSELGIEPHRLTIVSGIGQAGKFPHYLKCNTFNGLHGRTLPVATGIRLANHDMITAAVAGDGDCYGEGGNHFIHAMRRNINVKLFVHDNQIYGLTKGQASPTSMEGMVTKNQPFGVFSEQLNPVALAVALDCSFAARGFAADLEHLKGLIKEALNHKGFTLIDILQPCVTFNKINTYEWYRQRVYQIEPEYNPEDRAGAFKKALEWGDRIPIGIIYKNHRPVLEDRIPVIIDKPLVKQLFDIAKLKGTMEEFY